MRKFINIALIVFILVLVIAIPVNKVYAHKITSIEVTQSGGKINVSGTAEAGTLAVAIMIYDSTGVNLITIQTTSVESDNTYSDSITIASGTYVVKVADYDGGEYVTKTVSPATETVTTPTPTATTTPSTNTTSTPEDTKTENNNSSTNPKTGDNIVLYGAVFVIALTGIVGMVIINKKRVKKSK